MFHCANIAQLGCSSTWRELRGCHSHLYNRKKTEPWESVISVRPIRELRLRGNYSPKIWRDRWMQSLIWEQKHLKPETGGNTCMVILTNQWRLRGSSLCLREATTPLQVLAPAILVGPHTAELREVPLWPWQVEEKNNPCETPPAPFSQQSPTLQGKIFHQHSIPPWRKAFATKYFWY